MFQLDNSLSDSAAVTVAAVLTTLMVVITISHGRHWYRQRHLRRIPGPPSQSFVYGNLQQIFSLQGWDFHKRMVQRYGRVVKIWGFFGDAQLHIADSKALYNVLIKDQDIFEETDAFIEANKLFFGPGLLGTLGDLHRRQRKLLVPIFSANHMRYMTPIFYKITHQLEDVLRIKLANGPQEVDMKEWMTRVALEIIGQSGLGYSFETLDESKSNQYAIAVKMLFPAFGGIPVLRKLLPYLCNLGTPSLRRFAVRFLPSKSVQLLIKATNTMDEMSRNIFYEKKAALKKGDDSVVHQIGEGRDIMSILMRSNLNGDEKDRMPDYELLGQMSTLVFSAMDTTSAALSRIFLLLSLNPEVQDKLRQEIVDARKEYGGDMDYDDLNALPYLEAICRETLRAYPPINQAPRIARRDTILPLRSPIKGSDGSTINEVYVPKNTTVIIGIRTLNTDPLIWGPDAAEWKPERWLSPLPESVTNARIPGVYSNMLTFLGGGRACIGFKFSQMEIKIILSLLIPSFRFSTTEKKTDWLMGIVAFPVVLGSTKPSMPLILTPIEA